MTIGFLSSSISRKGGGVSEVKRRLAQEISLIGSSSVEVYGLRDEASEGDHHLWDPLLPRTFKVVGPSAFGYAPGLLFALKKSGLDILHLHGMWQYPSYAALKSSIPYITTVHGMLDSWAIKNSAFKKKIARLLFENQALNSASCLQAFTIQEYNDIREYGLRNPVCIIPNGVDVPDHLEELRMNVAPWGGKIEPGKKVLLYLGRIHPKKGLVNLIKAWKDVTSQGFSLEEWSLVIAGWNQGDHEQQLKELTKEAKLERDIHFIGPQFGLQKEITLAHADAFILPSFSEGLPMAVLEAWAFGLPVIMTPQCNLPEGFEAGAAVCIQPSVMGVAEGLKSTLRLSPEELNSMGAAGRLLVKQKFSWKEVAKKMNVIYEWILSKKETPSYLIEN